MKDKYTLRTISSDESNEEEDNFVNKLIRGSSKHKGNIPFKCFNCGKIGHFASKCPYAKTKDKNEEKGNSRRKGNEKKLQRGNKTRNKKKRYYSKEENSSDEEGSDFDTEYELDRLIFMALNNKNESLEPE